MKKRGEEEEEEGGGGEQQENIDNMTTNACTLKIVFGRVVFGEFFVAVILFIIQNKSEMKRVLGKIYNGIMGCCDSIYLIYNIL